MLLHTLNRRRKLCEMKRRNFNFKSYVQYRQTADYFSFVHMRTKATIADLVASTVIVQGVFSLGQAQWASPKKLKYGKPRFGESTLT